MKQNKLLSLILTLIAVSFLFSCSKNEEFRTRNDEIEELQDYIIENQISVQPSWTGLYYFEDEAGTGISPLSYDTVVVDFSITDLFGNNVASTADLGEPITFLQGDRGIIPGLNETLLNMKEGGKSRAIIPSTIAFGGSRYDNIDPYTTLIYDVNLLEVKPGIVLEDYNTDSLSMITTASGLQYYIIEQNERIMVKAGDAVSIHYTGYFTDGNIFDSSVKRGSPSTFTFGIGGLIPGWEEGVLLMKEGEKFRFKIPSELAYGEEGSFPIIPPNATLIFDVEVMEIY